MRLGTLESPSISSKMRPHKTSWVLRVFCSLVIFSICCLTMLLKFGWILRHFLRQPSAFSRLCLGQILKCKLGAFVGLALCCKSYSAMSLGCILEGFYIFDLFYLPSKNQIYIYIQPTSPQEQGNIWAYKISVGRWPTFCLCPWRKWASITCCSDVPSFILYGTDMDDRATSSKHFGGPQENWPPLEIHFRL